MFAVRAVEFRTHSVNACVVHVWVDRGFPDGVTTRAGSDNTLFGVGLLGVFGVVFCLVVECVSGFLPDTVHL